MTNLIPYSDLEKIGKTLAASKLFGMKTPDEAIALCLIAQAEGKHPATAAQEYHVIQGKPALKADAMLARFQTAGGKVKWISYTDKEVSGEFSHPQGGSVTIAWNMEMATKLGFHTKDNWKKFPRAMMRARCISEGVRTVYPGIAVGIYTPEEVQDFEPEMVNITPSEPIDKSKPASPFKNNSLRTQYQNNIVDSFATAKSVRDLDTIIDLEKDKLKSLENTGDERDQMVVSTLRQRYALRKSQLQQRSPDPNEEDYEFDASDVPDHIREMDEHIKGITQ